MLSMQEIRTSDCNADYPKMKNKTSMFKKPFKKREMKATWDDSEVEPEEKVDTANMCFMTQGDNASKV